MPGGDLGLGVQIHSAPSAPPGGIAGHRPGALALIGVLRWRERHNQASLFPKGFEGFEEGLELGKPFGEDLGQLVSVSCGPMGDRFLLPHLEQPVDHSGQWGIFTVEQLDQARQRVGLWRGLPGAQQFAGQADPLSIG